MDGKRLRFSLSRLSRVLMLRDSPLILYNRLERTWTLFWRPTTDRL